MVSASNEVELTVFYHILSQPSRAVLTLCNIGGFKFEPRVVDLAGEQKSPEFKKINPEGVVPAIKEVSGNDQFVLSESHAIMKYLVESRNMADHWYPKDHR